MVQRAPLFLRAVVAEDGTKDVLDQLEDTPSSSERVSVYRRRGEAGHVHLNFGGSNRRTGFYASAEYQHLSDVDGERLRDNGAWHDWVYEQPEVTS